MEALEESLRNVRNEIEYFANRYNELPSGEYKDQIWVILLLAKAGEQVIVAEINKTSAKESKLG